MHQVSEFTQKCIQMKISGKNGNKSQSSRKNEYKVQSSHKILPSCRCTVACKRSQVACFTYCKTDHNFRIFRTKSRKLQISHTRRAPKLQVNCKITCDEKYIFTHELANTTFYRKQIRNISFKNKHGGLFVFRKVIVREIFTKTSKYLKIYDSPLWNTFHRGLYIRKWLSIQKHLGNVWGNIDKYKNLLKK